MEPNRNEIVYVRSLDGFEFEKFCANLIEKLGWGKTTLTPKTGDGGKDIIVKIDNSKYMFVECKNQPSTNIGRPIIQKLDSAVRYENASKGIVITTGKFSNEAVEYAKKLDIEMKLIDILELTRLAASIGITIVSDEDISEHYYKPYPSEPELTKIQYSLLNAVKTYPRTIGDLVSFSDIKKSFFTIYYFNYSIHEEFSTSVGIVHKIHEDDMHLYLKGSTGKGVEPNIIEFVKPDEISNLKPISELNERINDTETIGQNVDVGTLSKLAKKWIIEEHTKKVEYKGKNNVQYKKEFVPSKTSIGLKRIISINVHYRQVKMIQSSYSKDFISIDGPTSVLLDHPIALCDYCGGKRKLIACDSCSRIADSGIVKHGKRCSICKKTICINCVYRHKTPSFIRGYTCENCSKQIYGEEYVKRKLKRVRKPNYLEKIKEVRSFKLD